MKASIELELKPFTVPNFVVYSDFNGTQKDSIPLKLVPDDVLYKLCKQFVEDVFKKAEKPNTVSFISKR